MLFSMSAYLAWRFAIEFIIGNRFPYEFHKPRAVVTDMQSEAKSLNNAFGYALALFPASWALIFFLVLSSLILATVAFRWLNGPGLYVAAIIAFVAGFTVDFVTRIFIGGRAGLGRGENFFSIISSREDILGLVVLAAVGAGIVGIIIGVGYSGLDAEARTRLHYSYVSYCLFLPALCAQWMFVWIAGPISTGVFAVSLFILTIAVLVKAAYLTKILNNRYPERIRRNGLQALTLITLETMTFFISIWTYVAILWISSGIDLS